MNIISSCCGKSIGEGVAYESPLGDRFKIAYKVNCCEECGEQCELVEACECCGEPFNDGRVWDTNLGDWCTTCVSLEVDRRAEQIRQEWDLVDAL